MAKFDAYGTILKIGDGGGPEVFTAIAQVTDITGPGLSLDTIDVTTHDSVDAWREFIGGLKDAGEVSFEVIFDPDSATHIALRTDMDSRVKRNFQLIFPDNTSTQWNLAAFVTELEPQMAVEDALMASLTLKLSGEPTLA